MRNKKIKNCGSRSETPAEQEETKVSKMEGEEADQIAKYCDRCQLLVQRLKNSIKYIFMTLDEPMLTKVEM